MSASIIGGDKIPIRRIKAITWLVCVEMVKVIGIYSAILQCIYTTGHRLVVVIIMAVHDWTCRCSSCPIASRSRASRLDWVRLSLMWHVHNTIPNAVAFDGSVRETEEVDDEMRMMIRKYV